MESKNGLLISIIVPVYNLENYVERNVEHIFRQDFDDYELIIVDDGSSDSTLERLKKYEGRKNLRVFPRPHGGVSRARNFGMYQAKGEYLLFLDGDDYLEPGSLKHYGKYLQESEAEVVVAQSNILFYDREDTSSVTLTTEVIPIESYIRLMIETDHYFYAPAQYIVRRDFIKKMEFEFPIDLLHEDVTWVINLLTSIEKIATVNKTLYNFDRTNESSITNTINLKRMEDTLSQCDGLIEADDFGPYIGEEIKEVFAQRIIGSCFMQIKYFVKESKESIPEMEKIIKPYMGLLKKGKKTSYKMFCKTSRIFGLKTGLKVLEKLP